MRLELKSDINNIQRQFELLESGRLTRLETKINKFEVAQGKRDSDLRENQAVLSTRFLAYSGITLAVFNAVLYVVLKRIFG